MSKLQRMRRGPRMKHTNDFYIQTKVPNATNGSTGRSKNPFHQRFREKRKTKPNAPQDTNMQITSLITCLPPLPENAVHPTSNTPLSSPPTHFRLTFFIWNLMVARTVSTLLWRLSPALTRVGNLPALVRPGPSRRGICNTAKIRKKKLTENHASVNS